VVPTWVLFRRPVVVFLKFTYGPHDSTGWTAHDGTPSRPIGRRSAPRRWKPPPGSSPAIQDRYPPPAV